MTASHDVGQLLQELGAHRLPEVLLLALDDGPDLVLVLQRRLDAGEEAVAVRPVIPQDADGLAVQRREPAARWLPSFDGSSTGVSTSIETLALSCYVLIFLVTGSVASG